MSIEVKPPGVKGSLNAADTIAILKMCKRKVRFSTKIQALMKASCVLRKGRRCNTDYLRPYHCPICHGYHLTSKKPLKQLASMDVKGNYA